MRARVFKSTEESRENRPRDERKKERKIIYLGFQTKVGFRCVLFLSLFSFSSHFLPGVEKAFVAVLAEKDRARGCFERKRENAVALKLLLFLSFFLFVFAESFIHIFIKRVIRGEL